MKKFPLPSSLLSAYFSPTIVVLNHFPFLKYTCSLTAWQGGCISKNGLLLKDHDDDDDDDVDHALIAFFSCSRFSFSELRLIRHVTDQGVIVYGTINTTHFLMSPFMTQLKRKHYSFDGYNLFLFRPYSNTTCIYLCNKWPFMFPTEELV